MMRTQTMTVGGHEIQVGDVMRFRISKYDPISWLTVTAVKPTTSGKRFHVSMGDHCYERVSRKDKRQIRRAVALQNTAEVA